MNEQENIQLPKVCVLIANYNYGHYIYSAIESAYKQDYPNLEIYICDDASTDNSIEKVIEYCSGNVKIINDNENYTLYNINEKLPCEVFLFAIKQNSGPSRTRNIGIQYALQNNCHIFQILDSDDILQQSRISLAVAEIIKDPQTIAGVYTDYMILDTSTNSITYEAKENYDWNKLVQNCIVHSGCTINGLAFQQFGLYDEDLRVCEDYNLFLRFGRAMMFIHIPIPLAIIRNQPMNSTLTVDKSRWQRDYQLAKQRALSN